LSNAGCLSAHIVWATRAPPGLVARRQEAVNTNFVEVGIVVCDSLECHLHCEGACCLSGLVHTRLTKAPHVTCCTGDGGNALIFEAVLPQVCSLKEGVRAQHLPQEPLPAQADVEAVMQA